jgi:hypothetical protein
LVTSDLKLLNLKETNASWGEGSFTIESVLFDRQSWLTIHGTLPTMTSIPDLRSLGQVASRDKRLEAWKNRIFSREK